MADTLNLKDQEISKDISECKSKAIHGDGITNVTNGYKSTVWPRTIEAISSSSVPGEVLFTGNVDDNIDSENDNENETWSLFSLAAVPLTDVSLSPSLFNLQSTHPPTQSQSPSQQPAAAIPSASHSSAHPSLIQESLSGSSSSDSVLYAAVTTADRMSTSRNEEYRKHDILRTHSPQPFRNISADTLIPSQIQIHRGLKHSNDREAMVLSEMPRTRSDTLLQKPSVFAQVNLFSDATGDILPAQLCPDAQSSNRSFCATEASESEAALGRGLNLRTTTHLDGSYCTDSSAGSRAEVNADFGEELTDLKRFYAS